jgi:hypothetical protein
MFLPKLRRISRPRTPQVHDTTTITHEHIPEIFSPQYADSASQPPYPTYYHPSPLGLFAEGDGTPFPPVEPDTQMEVEDPLRPPRLQVEGYTIEGGWQPDGFGGIRYQEYGKVEDVSDSNNHGKKSKSTSEGNSIIPGDYDGPITITSPLPSTATPPPAPNFRARRIEIPELGFMGGFASVPGLNLRAMPYPKLSNLGPTSSTPPPRNIKPNGTHSHHPLFDSSPNPGQIGTPPVEQHHSPSGNAPPPQNVNPSLPESQSPVRERPTRPPPLSPLHATELDDPQESSVLQSNLRLIKPALGSLDNMIWVCSLFSLFSAENPH